MLLRPSNFHCLPSLGPVGTLTKLFLGNSTYLCTVGWNSYKLKIPWCSASFQ